MKKARWPSWTDIQGVEDHLGDMDFKVAGTREGITALQMDIKIEGVTFEIMEQALRQAKDARMEILGKMPEVLPEARPEMAASARARDDHSRSSDRQDRRADWPRRQEHPWHSGSAGEVKIDVEEDGKVYVSATNGESAKGAEADVRRVGIEVEIGQVYDGKVVRIADFGRVP